MKNISISYFIKTFLYFKIYLKYKKYTMISRNTYIKNLQLCELFKNIEGAIVECGTWRGGMIAGIGDILDSNRVYYLFDSFEGLPEPKEIDGNSAVEYTLNTDSEFYFNNCTASEESAKEAMSTSRAENYYIVKGWFNESLTKFDVSKKIAILRLDADWYDSTMDCLDTLYDSVTPGGVIIFDDYYTWDGCSKAVHDFLSKRQSISKIRQFNDNIAFIIKGIS